MPQTITQDPILTKAFAYEKRATERFIEYYRGIAPVNVDYSQDIDPFACWDSHIYKTNAAKGLWLEIKQRADKCAAFPDLMLEVHKYNDLMKLQGAHYYLNIICGTLYIFNLDKLNFDDCFYREYFPRTVSSWDNRYKDSPVWLIPKKFATIISLN